MADNSFAKGFESTFKSGLAIGSSAAEKSIAEKIKKEKEASNEKAELASIKEIALKQAMLAQKNPDIDEPTKKLIGNQLDLISETKNLSQAQKILTSTRDFYEGQVGTQSSEQRSVGLAAQKASAVEQAKQPFDVANKQFESSMSSINSTIDTLQKQGGQTPEQLDSIRSILVEQAKQSAYGNIKDPSQPSLSGIQAAENKEALEFLKKPLPKKLSAKQQDLKDSLDHGLKVLDLTEEMYNDISNKYGTGRLKGLETTLRGKMGDLLSPGQRAPEVVPYLNNLEGLANFIGKSIYKDERVSDVNIKGYKKALAKLTNTPTEAKIMFSLLRKYAQDPDNLAAEKALRNLIPLSGESSNIKPSKAAMDNNALTREEKIAILKELG